jgi:SOS-response transcriptional repressor LexA
MTRLKSIAMNKPFQRLRFAREQAGYRSAADFSRANGITEVTYRAHENGQNGLKVDVAERYARLLGNCTAAWLLTGTPPPPVFLERLGGLRASMTAAPNGAYADDQRSQIAEFEAMLPGADDFARTQAHKPAGVAESDAIEAKPGVTVEGISDLELLKALYGDNPDAFWMRANTDAMNRAGIMRGDYMIVDADRIPAPGQIVVANVHDDQTGTDETVLRANYAGILQAQSTSPAHRDVLLDDSVAIMGTVVVVHRRTA